MFIVCLLELVSPKIASSAQFRLLEFVTAGVMCFAVKEEINIQASKVNAYVHRQTQTYVWCQSLNRWART